MTNQHTPDRVVSHDAAWIDKRARGRLRFAGKDAASFLHALVSNDVDGLQSGRGVYATYLTPQGRMIADLRIHHRGDHLLADVPEGTARALSERFDSLIFAEDVRVSNVSDVVAEIAVVGTQAAAAIGRAIAVDADRLSHLPIWAHDASGDIIVARADDFAVPSFDLFAPMEEYDDILRRLAGEGVQALSASGADALRIEAGRPVFGVDMTGDTIPLEAGLLERAISQNKGCYVGQEVIVRVLHRGGGRVAKRLVTLEFDGANTRVLAAGSPISVDGRETGRITSAVWSPRLDRVVALGYVHRDDAEAGRLVTVRAASGEPVDAAARVTGLAG